MRPATIKKIRAIIDEELRASDFPTAAQAQKALSIFFRSGTGQPKTLFKSGTTMGIYDVLRDLPEPTPEEVGKLKLEFRKKLRPMVLETAKRIPIPPGGRPRKLNERESRVVCEEIGELLGQGVDLKDAQARIARRYGTGLRTIQRAWQANKKVKKPLRAKQVPKESTL